jgi:ribosome maturation factor RimP
VLSRLEIWSGLEKVVAEQGLRLFDLEMPSRCSGILRVFITSAGQVDSTKNGYCGASIDDCAAVSRKIASHPDFRELLDYYSLEVSSPGVNRNLKRPEHFAEAVGERIKITAHETDGSECVYHGIMVAFDGAGIEVDVEELSEKLRFQLVDIKKARVDFLFQ